MELESHQRTAAMAAAPCLIGLTLRLQSRSKTLLNDIPLVATIRIGVQIAQAFRDHLSVPLGDVDRRGRVVIRCHNDAR
jgi:hypothetical protein